MALPAKDISEASRDVLSRLFQRHRISDHLVCDENPGGLVVVSVRAGLGLDDVIENGSLWKGPVYSVREITALLKDAHISGYIRRHTVDSIPPSYASNYCILADELSANLLKLRHLIEHPEHSEGLQKLRAVVPVDSHAEPVTPQKAAPLVTEPAPGVVTFAARQGFGRPKPLPALGTGARNAEDEHSATVVDFLARRNAERGPDKQR